eukprot:403345905
MDNSSLYDKCKVILCQHIHKKHYCKICCNTDSNHFSKYCPKGTILWHGTKLENIESILENGFYQSREGSMGAGIYLTTKEEALSIAKHRGNQNQSKYVVIQVRVNLGKILELKENHDFEGKWRENQFNSATRFHFSWAGIKTKFQEWIVKDNSQLQIMGYFEEDGSYFEVYRDYKQRKYQGFKMQKKEYFIIQQKNSIQELVQLKKEIEYKIQGCHEIIEIIEKDIKFLDKMIKMVDRSDLLGSLSDQHLQKRYDKKEKEIQLQQLKIEISVINEKITSLQQQLM